MQKNSNIMGKVKQIVLFLFLTLFSAIVFQYTADIVHQLRPVITFFDFDRFSESLVLGEIVADDNGLDKKGGHLGRIFPNGSKYPDNLFDVYEIFSGKSESVGITFHPKASQYGIQGAIFSKAHSIFGLNKLSQLQSINSILLAIVVVSLFFLYREIYDKYFSAIFLITIVSSPWMVAFAKNLYWVTFLWFMPALVAAILYLQRNSIVRAFLLLAIAFSMFLKSLAGYEYLSTITLFACSVFVVAPFFKYSEQKPSIDWTMLFMVFSACVVGFGAAILVHASMSLKGDSIITGLQNIYELDVKRRTYGDPSSFSPSLKASLESSPLSVLTTYINHWEMTLVAWLPGSYFRILIVFSLVGLLFQFWKRHPTRHRDGVLLAFFFMVSISWFVLAKAHSYEHTHLNYVLWYFGFVQALFYVSINSANAFSLSIVKWMKSKSVKE
jgi:hypothetical protein